MAIRAAEKKATLDERMRALAFGYMAGYNVGGSAVFSAMEEWAGLRRRLEEASLRPREINRVMDPYEDFLRQLALDTCVEMDKIITNYNGEENPTREFLRQTLTAFRKKLQSFYNAGLHRNGYLSSFGSSLSPYRAFEQQLAQDLRDLEAGRPLSRLELASQSDNSGAQDQPVDVASSELQTDFSDPTESRGNYSSSSMLRDKYKDNNRSVRHKARSNENGHLPGRRPEDIALEQQVIQAWREKGQNGHRLASDVHEAVGWFRATHRKQPYSDSFAVLIIKDYMARQYGYPSIFGKGS